LKKTVPKLFGTPRTGIEVLTLAAWAEGETHVRDLIMETLNCGKSQFVVLIDIENRNLEWMWIVVSSMV
jgi:hypothetical protein